MGKVNDVLQIIKEDFSRHLSFVYERVCCSLLARNSADFFPFEKLGRWWDKNEEIDLVGINSSLDSILFAEVKWTNKLVGIDIYAKLKEKAGKVSWGTTRRKEYFCLFSKQGFTKAMLKKAKAENVALFCGESYC